MACVTRAQRTRTEGWTHRGKSWQREGGFTLIELLVVIVILGILAAVVVFAVGGIDDRGEQAALRQDARTLRTAEEVYFAQNGRYATEEELDGGGFLSGESTLHKIYVNNGAGSCPAGSQCQYTIAEEDEEAQILVYSGRTAGLTGPLLTQFTADTGIGVTANYDGGSSGRANALISEGATTPADVFFSQDAGTLGQVSRAGLFTTVPQGTTARVTNPKFSARDNTWVGVSGRVRVIAHDPAVVPAAGVPTSVFDLTQLTWSGEVGYDPLNTSFQNFVAAMILTDGETATQQWLVDFKNNNPVRIGGNINIAKAVAAGTIQLGLLNHYYRFQLTADEQTRVANSYPTGGDPGSLVNTAGAGILANTDSPGAAEAFVKYLLSTPSQTYFRDTTREYPLVAEVQPSSALVPLDQIQSPDIDLNDIDNGAAVALLNSTGHLP